MNHAVGKREEPPEIGGPWGGLKERLSLAGFRLLMFLQDIGSSNSP